MKIKLVLFFLILVSLISCNSGEDEVEQTSLDNDLATPTIPETKTETETDTDNQQEQDNPPLVYKFDHLTGKCFDEEKIEGFNLGHLGDCGDLSDSTINDDLNKKFFFGLVLNGTKLVDNKISFHRLARAEVKTNDDTEYPDKINAPNTSFFLGHSNAYRFYKKKEVQYYEKYLEQREKFKQLKSEYKAIPKSEKKARKIKLNQIKKAKIKLSKFIKSKKVLKNKSKRQKKYLKSKYKLARAEDKFINQKIRNKEFLTLNGNSSYSFKESNKVFPHTKTFTISLWLKTDMDQNDKRLINLHRGQNPGSALNLSLKSERIVLGVHDGNKYHSVENKKSYDDGEWHHFLITKKKNKIFIYFDGIKINEYEGEFSGLGTFPAQLGSYNGKGYYYTGELDEVSLWQSYFSKSDVKRLYNEGVPSNVFYHRQVTSILHWWRLGDNKKDTEESLIDVVAKEVMTKN